MTQEERLVKAYIESRDRILKAIENRLRWGKLASQQKIMLDFIDQELEKLNAAAGTFTREAVQQSFLTGAIDAYKVIAPTAAVPAYSAFTGLHKPAIDLLVHNSQNFFTIANNLIARQAKDVIRDMGVRATTHKYAEGLTWQQMKAELQEVLQADGFNRVPYRFTPGTMRADSYAELVARTTTAEATNTGTINQMEEMEEYLVKMTSHSPTCKICAPRQGRVYRLRDFPAGDPRNQFPHISEGMPRWPMYKTVHVNCRHRIVAYVWDQKTDADQQAALQRAGDPFDTDPRSEVKRYDAAQKKLADRLRDRYQWERYKTVLPNDAPTFSGFRAMKQADSERYQELREDYRKAMKYANLQNDAKAKRGYFDYGPVK